MDSTARSLEVCKVSTEQARINYVYLNPQDAGRPSEFVMLDSGFLFLPTSNASLAPGNIGLSKIQRECLNKSATDNRVQIDFIGREYIEDLRSLSLNIEALSIQPLELDAGDLRERIHEVYDGFPFNQGQRLFIETEAGGTVVILAVAQLRSDHPAPYGVLDASTEIVLASNSARVTLANNSRLARHDFSLTDLGIGGLKSEFEQMFRRAFVQRLFDPDVISRFGIAHVKGIILHGPPGTGKTLIARKLGALLDARPPKIVNGPEILNKYVGQSEENIRNLFTDAEAEYRARGAHSQLHIIIFDEIDAICKRRGHGGNAGAGDQVVNQLLAKMDGVEALDNILVIGMTNRLDMIDEALLRPGRFEIHLEISLPDAGARQEILEIHTREMAENKLLDSGIDLASLAGAAKNYTGAELAAVVRSASSFALERQVELRKLAAQALSDGPGAAESTADPATRRASAAAEAPVRVTAEDFAKALGEVRPAFGINEAELAAFDRVFYETRAVQRVTAVYRDTLVHLRATNLYRTASVLLEGPTGSGKSVLAVRLARESGFPFVKLISPRVLVGLAEYEKVNYIKDTFYDAYKSEEACVILDDMEGLIEYVELGCRFSNSILQALKIFVKGEGKNKLCVIGTTAAPEVLRECGVVEAFAEVIAVSAVNQEDYEALCAQNEQFRAVPYTGPVPIKRLLMQLPSADTSMK